ncbi:hypothetical protein JVU11DRAFT_2958 [Chiua virens]|nr:hypothetical protein JVU11DRAFT_2958 [Chiua virens]
MASQSRPEPMNASPHHSKVKVTLTLSDPVYVSGGHISGKMQVESRADLDSLVGVGVMMVELYAIQEVNFAEHSATSTFLHSRRIFQGPGLPPSNAVYSDYIPESGELPLPAYHYAARRGQTTFFFQFPIPSSSPSSINFGPASIRYEIRAGVSVAWRGEKRLVTDKQEVKVVECWEPTNGTPSPRAMVITEGGNIWAQATLTSGMVVGGESACIDLQLRNHTQRWTSGITVTLMRDLHLSQSFLAGESPPNSSDVATQVEFRGPEYSVPPGIEGIATLVIDIPRHSRGVKGGLRVDDNGKTTEGFFEVCCTLRLTIEMPPGSEDTVITMPVTIYHSLAVPEALVSPQHFPSYPYAASVSPELLSPPSGTALTHLYTGNSMQQYDPTRASAVQQVSMSNQHLEAEAYNWQDASPYAPSMQPSVSADPLSQVSHYILGSSTPYMPSPRLLPPPPARGPYPNYISPGIPVKTVDTFTNSEGAVPAPTSQNYSAAHHLSISPIPPRSPSEPRVPDNPLPPNRSRPPPIQIPSLPNPHDSQGVLHSPRPIVSPKQSFYGSIPKSDNVSNLERMADEVGKQTGDLSLDLPKGDTGMEVRGLQGPKSNLSMDKTLPAPPVPSSRDRHLSAQRPHVDTLFMTEATMFDHSGFPSTDHLPHAPPTPPIAAITPIKFPKAQPELLGLGANLGKDVPSESGLDALERRLLAEVGTRKFDTDERPHVRNVVQPITIPPSGPPHDTVNDSAISSLTLADREGFLNSTQEREQEQDRDSDEHTQQMGGGHSPSEDDRDARTQQGKSSRKLGKSKHSEEDLERVGRRRERKKAKDHEGRKLRKEAKGRVAAWLGEIDISVPPVMDDPASFISPTASHFVPITESASFYPAQTDMMEDDKDVSASPNPRSSGFVTISSLEANGSGGQGSSFKPSSRRSSVNDFRQTPTTSRNQPTTARRPPASRSPSAEVKPSQPVDTPPRTQPLRSPSPPSQSPHLLPGRLPRFPSKLTDPEVKYDVRSARGGRGGKVTQVASLWAAKANSANAAKLGDTTPVAAASGPKKPKLPSLPPAVRRPVINGVKRGPMPTRPAPAILLGVRSGAGVAGPGRGMCSGAGGVIGSVVGLGTRESKATTVPAVLSSSHAVPMLTSTASLARVKVHGAAQGQGRSLPPMISETISDLKSVSKTSAGAGGGGRGGLGELAFGQARLRDLIKKYQG